MNTILRLAKQQRISAPALGLLVLIYLTPRFTARERLTGPEVFELAELRKPAYKAACKELQELPIRLVKIDETTGDKSSKIHVWFQHLSSVEIESLEKFLEDN